MKLNQNIEYKQIEHIINDADTICKSFDPNSNCKQYLVEKLNNKNTTVYNFEYNNKLTGIAILEIIDKHYGNLIVHTINEEDEATMAHALTLDKVINSHVLELIQFRSGFNYRDEFIRMGLREKERMRMKHQDIQKYQFIKEKQNIQFKPITITDNQTCGNISYNAHKHRQHIECYDVYTSPENRAKFSNDLRQGKHGRPIENGCLIMTYKEEPIGLIEVLHTKNWNIDMGWIMDIALLPKYQGMGFGKHMIEYSLKNLYLSGYESVGLAVTLTNKNAHQLYQNIGFEDTEFFVEIIG